MNWEAIGAIGEVLGAAAVVATLGYLAVQIRQNSRAVKNSAAQSMLSEANASLRVASSDPSTARAVILGQSLFNILGRHIVGLDILALIAQLLDIAHNRGAAWPKQQVECHSRSHQKSQGQDAGATREQEHHRSAR